MILNMGLGSHMIILVIGILKERTNIYIYIHVYIYIYFINTSTHFANKTWRDCLTKQRMFPRAKYKNPETNCKFTPWQNYRAAGFKTLAAASSVRLKQKTWWTQSWKLCQWLMISLQYTKLPQTNYLKFGCLWMLMFTLLWMIHLYPFM